MLTNWYGIKTKKAERGVVEYGFNVDHPSECHQAESEEYHNQEIKHASSAENTRQR